MRKYICAFVLVLPVACGPTNTKAEQSQPDQSAVDSTSEGREAQEALAFVEERLRDADPSDDAFYRMVRDLGGLASFEEALATRDTAALTELHQRYGLIYALEAPEELTTSLLADPWSACVPFYPVELRNRTFSGQGMQVHIDAAGRPVWVLKSWVPWSVPQAAARTSCQQTVGGWGNTDDVGGHLIPAAVGGWGGRANLVPQNGKMNGGAWSTVENQVTRCLGGEEAVEYRVTAIYPFATTLRPSELAARLTLKRGSATTAWSEARMANRVPTSIERNTAARFSAFFQRECPVPTPAKVTCSVFDDGYTNVAGPSDAIFFSGGKACIGNGTSAGACRKWFGRCTTPGGDRVRFKVFDDAGQAATALSDAVFINADNKACIGNGTGAGECRKWFGDPQTDGGMAAECRLFGDGYTSLTGSTRAIYDSADQSCMPNGTSSPICRKWWGRCLVGPVPATPETPVCVDHTAQCDSSHVCCGSNAGRPDQCVPSPRHGDNRCYSNFMDVEIAERTRPLGCAPGPQNPFGFQTLVYFRQGWYEDGIAAYANWRGAEVDAPAYPTKSSDVWMCGWPNAFTQSGLPLCPGAPGC